MSFALRATQRLFKSPLIGSTLDLLHCLSAQTVRLCNYLLVFSIQQFGMLQFSHHSLLELNDRLCSYPFGLQHCLTAYRLSTDGGCFRFWQRVNPNPGLFRWTIAGASLWETLLWSSYLLYP